MHMKRLTSKLFYLVIIGGLLIGLSFSCEPDDPSEEKNLPQLTTVNVANITGTSATSGGNVTSDGGSEVTGKGVCWSTSENPTISDSKTNDGSGTGTFTSSITGLTINTTYYVRAYATNAKGTAYGNMISFTTIGDTNTSSITVNTATVSPIMETSAVSGGEVIADGSSLITAKGVCWSTSQNPTIDDQKTDDGTGVGTFTSQMTGLSATTTYYVRAYATTASGTTYGSEVSFTTTGKVSDKDGNQYKTVVIGTQTWMMENLATTKYNNGDAIGTSSTLNEDLSTDVYAKYQWPYNGDETKVNTYGRLYTWNAATDSRGVCPTGYHIPTEEEWLILSEYVGSESIAALELKEVGTAHWASNDNATNSSGFTALPGGVRTPEGVFQGLGESAYWWAAKQTCSDGQHGGYYRFINSAIAGDVFGENCHSAVHGQSIRCIKD